jgi:hypothetical protein
MAGAKIDVSFSEKIDVASGVWTHGVERLDLIAGAAEVNCADGNLGEFIPGVDPIGEDGEFAGYAIVGQRLKGGNTDCGAGSGSSAERIEKDFEAGNDRDNTEHCANDSRQKALEEIASANWRRRIKRIVHTQMRRQMFKKCSGKRQLLKVVEALKR